MIASIQILAPQSIIAGEPFEILLRGLDGQGKVDTLATDTVTLSSADPFLVFSLDNDPNNGGDPYGSQVVVTLAGGEATVWGKDTKGESFTLHVSDGEGSEGQKTIAFNFAALKVTLYDTDPPQGTSTQDHYSFFSPRVDAEIVSSPVPPSQPLNPAGSMVRWGDDALGVIAGGNIAHRASVLSGELNIGDPVVLWPQDDEVSSYSLTAPQPAVGNPPTYDVRDGVSEVKFQGGESLCIPLSERLAVVPENSDFTIMLGFSPIDLGPVGAKQTLLSQGESLSLVYENSIPKAEIEGNDPYPGITLGGAQPMEAGEYYHLMFIRAGDNFRLYMDNDEIAGHDDQTALRKIGGGMLSIGAAPTISGDFLRAGVLEIQVMHKALGADDRNKAYNNFLAGHGLMGAMKWVPREDPNVIAWFDAPRYTKEPYVTQWKDLSDNDITTNHNNAWNVSAPLFWGTGINDFPTLYFDGNQKHLHADGVCPLILSGGGGSFTISFICAPIFTRPSNNVPPKIVGFWTNNGNNLFMLQVNPKINPSNRNNIQIYDQSTPEQQSISDFGTGDVLLISWVFDATTGQHEVYINDKLEISYTSTLRIATNSKFSIGQDWDGSAVTDFYNGYMGTVLIASGTDQKLRERMEGYLTYEYFKIGDIPGISLHLAADDAGGSPFAQWEDLSGGGNHAAPLPGGQAPGIVQGALNGHTGIRFTGQDPLALPFALPHETFTAFMVMRSEAAGGAEQGNLLSTDAWQISMTNGCLEYAHLPPGGDSLETTLRLKNPLVLIVEKDNDTVRLGKNGKLNYTKQITGNGVNGGNAIIGGSGFAGDVYEICVYDRVLSPRELQGISSRLLLRYSLSAPKPALPNLKFEFDAHDIKGLNPRDAVVTLPDRSGNGADAVQNNAGNQGRYFPGIMGGYPAVEFASKPDFYVSPTIPATGAGPRMIVAVAAPRNKTVNYGYIATWGNASTGQSFGLVTFTDSVYQYSMTTWGFIGQGAGVFGPAPQGRPEVIITAYDAGQGYLWVNGELKAQGNMTINTGSDFPLTIGTNHSSGHRSQCFEGFIGYVAVAAHFPSDEEVGEITSWLANQFGIIL